MYTFTFDERLYIPTLSTVACAVVAVKIKLIVISQLLHNFDQQTPRLLTCFTTRSHSFAHPVFRAQDEKSVGVLQQL